MEVCYRHTDRETGVGCSNCGRPICPDCMTPTSVGMRCPECAGQKTEVRTMRSMTDDPTLTYVLMGISVVAALGGLMAGNGGGELYEYGALSRVEMADKEYWRMITAGFLHAPFTGGGIGPLHLIFNMFMLYILGTMLEPIVRRLRFGLIYFVSLLAGGFGALLLEPDSSVVGASGAVFGLMGAAVVVLRSRGIGLMQSGLGIWIGLNLLISFRPGISLGGHLGGLVGGALTALILYELSDRVRMPRRVPELLCGVLGVAAVIGAIAVSASAG